VLEALRGEDLRLDRGRRDETRDHRDLRMLL
jgi:hypothetical protein